MTINKIGLSALAAAMITTASFGATITLPGNSNAALTVATELAENQDVVITEALLEAGEMNIVSGLAAPVTGVSLTITKADGGVFTTLPSTVELVHVNTASDYNITIADSATVSGDKKSIVLTAHAASTTMLPGESYVLVESNATAANNAAYAGWDVNMTQGDSLTLNLLFTNQSGTEVDSGTVLVATPGVAQLAATITTSFDAEIDASSTFQNFVTGTADDSVLTWTTTPGNNDYPLTLKTVHSQGTTTGDFAGNFTYAATGATADTNTTGLATFYSYKTTAAGGTLTSTFTQTATDTATIPEATFTLTSAIATINDGTNADTNTTLLTNRALGSWSIYGYNAQIAGVVGNTINETKLRFTNSSSTPSEVYFTLIDEDGTSVQIGSVADGIASLPAGQTTMYLATDLAALAVAKDIAFNSVGNFAVEVSIPTSPSEVYGYASQKNISGGFFKDLPIYSNSSKNQ